MFGDDLMAMKVVRKRNTEWKEKSKHYNINESTFTLEVKVKQNQIQLKSKAKKLINSKDSIVYLYYKLW